MRDKFLIVDDSRLISERRPDAKVTETIDAESALEAVCGGAPDVSITLVTANIQSSIRGRAEEFGCRFVAKPITAEKTDRLLSELGQKHEKLFHG